MNRLYALGPMILSHFKVGLLQVEFSTVLYLVLSKANLELQIINYIYMNARLLAYSSVLQ